MKTKKSKKVDNAHTILLIALAVAIVFAYASYTKDLERNKITKAADAVSEATTTAKITDEYTYKIEKVGSKTFRDVYKNGQFVRTELVK